MKKLAIKFYLPLLLSLLVFAFCSVASAQPVQSSVHYKQIPIEQWEILKQNQQSLELKLNELNVQLELLEKPLVELQAELNDAKIQLMQSQTELNKLNVQLSTVRDLQGRTQESLTKLTAQIDAEREKNRQIQNKLRVQRTIAWVVAGLILINK